MQVRTADTTDGYPDENLLFSGHWLLAIDQLQGKSGFSSNIARIDSEPTTFF